MRTLRFSGSRVRRAREQRKWSQGDLARAIGTSEMNIGRWERGDNKPSADHLAAIAQATGHAIEFFYVNGDAEEDEEDAALRRQALDLLAPLNDAMVNALLVAIKDRAAARDGAAA
jgi:transcriptional regulator with XRE-family HTH domain